MNLKIRPRRNRKNASIRDMVAETTLNASQLIMPLFICDGSGQKIAIKSMPNYFRLSVDQALKEIKEMQSLGVNTFALFPAIPDALKNSKASEALNASGLGIRMIKEIKNKFPDAVLMTDVALDPFNSDGHDGLVKNNEILNDETVEILAKMALLQAQAGSDIVAPSDMMDGRIGAIRKTLDSEGFKNTSIMAYSAKYASAYYGPFRDALESAPKFGDKKTYQMDYRNRTEALREAQLDIKEGADMVMVKPALAYLDIIREIKNSVKVPVAAYNVSGEYSMIKLAAQAGFCDEKKMILETLYSIKRAGSDIIITYFAKDFAKMQND